jgi:hypothetical protein
VCVFVCFFDGRPSDDKVCLGNCGFSASFLMIFRRKLKSLKTTVNSDLNIIGEKV